MTMVPTEDPLQRLTELEAEYDEMEGQHHLYPDILPSYLDEHRSSRLTAIIEVDSPLPKKKKKLKSGKKKKKHKSSKRIKSDASLLAEMMAGEVTKEAAPPVVEVPTPAVAKEKLKNPKKEEWPAPETPTRMPEPNVWDRSGGSSQSSNAEAKGNAWSSSFRSSSADSSGDNSISFETLFPSKSLSYKKSTADRTSSTWQSFRGSAVFEDNGVTDHGVFDTSGTTATTAASTMEASGSTESSAHSVSISRGSIVSENSSTTSSFEAAVSSLQPPRPQRVNTRSARFAKAREATRSANQPDIHQNSSSISKGLTVSTHECSSQSTSYSVIAQQQGSEIPVAPTESAPIESSVADEQRSFMLLKNYLEAIGNEPISDEELANLWGDCAVGVLVEEEPAKRTPAGSTSRRVRKRPQVARLSYSQGSGQTRLSPTIREQSGSSSENAQGDNSMPPTDFIEVESGSIVQARQIDEDSTVLQADASVLGLKHVINERPTRRRLILACVVVVFAIIGGIALAVTRDKDEDTAEYDSAPSNAPTSEPTIILESILTAAADISGDAVYQPGSPQRTAVAWFSGKDVADSTNDYEDFIQRYVLVCFYFSTGGPSWREQERWLDPTLHECDWGASISCKTLLTGRRVVTGLDEIKNGLSGSINAELSQLKDLVSFRVSNNAIGGSLPEFSGLSKLAVFDMNNNGLGGSIPDSIADATELDSINLGSNALTGQLPSQSMSKLTVLRELVLANNQLQGRPTAHLKGLQALTKLDLRDCQFTGSFPAEDIGLLANVAFAWFDHNRLTGTLPDWNPGLLSVDEVTFSHNQISGTLPAAPANIVDFFDADIRLRKLDMSYNKLNGTIPPIMSVIPAMEHLDISGNDFVGPFPDGGWQDLQHLAAAHNMFTGQVPVQFSDGMKHLDLSNNSLSGDAFPLALTSVLTNLEVLRLDDNPNLTGPIQGDFGKMARLRNLEASHCSLTGSLPQSLYSAPKLAIVNLEGNELTGTLSAGIGSLTTLKKLNVGSNLIEGSLPATLSNLKSLDMLTIRDNPLIEGSLSPELCSLLGPNVSAENIGCSLECSCCVDVEQVCGDNPFN